eukprot:SAG31_NODE_24384_length_482_cov_2.851175_2_plen_41_part_01
MGVYPVPATRPPATPACSSACGQEFEFHQPVPALLEVRCGS